MKWDNKQTKERKGKEKSPVYQIKCIGLGEEKIKFRAKQYVFIHFPKACGIFAFFLCMCEAVTPLTSG